jgi:hypothetical protein
VRFRGTKAVSGLATLADLKVHRVSAVTSEPEDLHGPGQVGSSGQSISRSRGRAFDLIHESAGRNFDRDPAPTESLRDRSENWKIHHAPVAVFHVLMVRQPRRMIS